MGWIIAASIVLFFVLLLAGRVSVFFDYNNDLALKIKYMCFTIVKMPKTKKKPEKPKKTKEKKEKKAEKAEKEKEEKKKDEKKKFDIKSLTFDDYIDLLKTALSGVGKPLKKLFKSIKFSHMSIDIVVGGSDAARTAIKFGAINFAAGNALGLIDSFFTLKPLDDMNITADFQSEKTLYDIYFEVRLSLFAALAAGFRLLGAFLKLLKEFKKKQKANLQRQKALERAQEKLPERSQEETG